MFYVEKDNKIVLFDENFEAIANVIEQMEEFKGLSILETDRLIQDFQFADTEEFKELKKQKEKEELDKLSLTKREVFLALYEDKGITPEQLRAQITDARALIEFDYANEYFRGNPLINQIGLSLGYTSEELDYLFKNKEF